jgi:hypothetical protein
MRVCLGYRSGPLLALRPCVRGKLVALVIRNSQRRMATSERFECAGFDAVVHKLDLRANGMRRALRAISPTRRAIIFWGNGLEIQGTNFAMSAT